MLVTDDGGIMLNSSEAGGEFGSVLNASGDAEGSEYGTYDGDGCTAYCWNDVAGAGGAKDACGGSKPTLADGGPKLECDQSFAGAGGYGLAAYVDGGGCDGAIKAVGGDAANVVEAVPKRSPSSSAASTADAPPTGGGEGRG